ncbi:MAG TPA: hypothetical protein PLD54_00545, partial [Candidatus Levybacteria bacterium]|nr:hypothetical protein [Candidatus Levybacteria bacterium]
MARLIKKKKKQKRITTNWYFYLIGLSVLVGAVLYFVNTFDSVDIRSRAVIEDSAYFGKSRGYFITPQELADIKRKSESNIQPHASNVKEVLTYTG